MHVLAAFLFVGHICALRGVAPGVVFKLLLRLSCCRECQGDLSRQVIVWTAREVQSHKETVVKGTLLLTVKVT